jgi:ABC-type bacteriocin/lantibiotic exporter with double-glycine peptidase domain
LTNFQGITIFFANFVIGGVLWYGGSLVISGDLTVGNLTSFIIYTLSVASGVGMLTGLYSEFMKALGTFPRIFSEISRRI